MVKIPSGIDRNALLASINAGTVGEVHLLATGEGWSLFTQNAIQLQKLVSDDGRTVYFSDLVCGAQYLAQLGITRFVVDSGHDAQRRFIDGASAFDRWVRELVEQSLNDPRPNVPGEEVEAMFAARRAALEQRLATQKK